MATSHVQRAPFPPCKKWNGRCHLIWSIPRPSTVKEYFHATEKARALLGEWGFELHDRDIWYVQRGHYCEEGNRFGFNEPVEIRFPDGGFIRFDKSLGIPETEYDSLDTFNAIVNYKVGADMVEELVKHVKALSNRMERLEKAASRSTAVDKIHCSKEKLDLSCQICYQRFDCRLWKWSSK